MPSISDSKLWLSIAILLFLIRPTAAFGAGNIASVAKIEGSNWRHGDIEDTLLSLFMSKAAGGKKFDKLNVARVYFGNWLRDYSQAIDVATVKHVSAEAIRILLWVLGFMTFGFGTKEFEVTAERLGCYRPEDHIDNPKDYADNVDARKFDARLRGPIDECVELAIDPQTGLKNFIANERANITTSASHIRKLFGQSIHLGRSYARSKNKEELYEALRLLGTGLHCLEDYAAHSNYVELALIELGAQDIFPHVGQRTKIRLQGARDDVYPIVTGTFGGVDFLHSVLGEFNDKATQSEIQELEGTMINGGKGDTTLLKEILGKIPKKIFGGKDAVGSVNKLQSNAAADQMKGVTISPRQPEEFTLHMQQVSEQIYPIIEWHDDILKGITETVEKIPILPDLISTLEEQVNIFVFSLIAPIILPLINQVKNELNTGSSEIIKSSQEKQFIVFDDDYCTNPTHSMLSKDHFSNVLNEPAGKIASETLKWVVPQLMHCWDDERADVDRTINRIINGVFHHPAQREYGEDGAVHGRRNMFGVVEQWWSSKSRQEKNELRQKLSSQGVRNGDNHEGTHDTGHGCGHPIKMNKKTGSGKHGFNTSISAISEFSSILPGNNAHSASSGIEKFASQAAGGGKLGSFVGAIAGGISGSFLSGAKKQHTQNYDSTYNQVESHEQDYNQTSGQSHGKHHEHQGHIKHHQHQGHEESSSGYSENNYGRKPEATSNYEAPPGRKTENLYGNNDHGNSCNNYLNDNPQGTSYNSEQDHTSGQGHPECPDNGRAGYGRNETASHGNSGYVSGQGYSEYPGNRREECGRNETTSYENSGYGSGQGCSEYPGNRREEYGRNETTSYENSGYGSGQVCSEYPGNRREEYGRNETTSYENSGYGSGQGCSEYPGNRREEYGRNETTSYENSGYGSGQGCSEYRGSRKRNDDNY